MLVNGLIHSRRLDGNVHTALRYVLVLMIGVLMLWMTSPAHANVEIEAGKLHIETDGETASSFVNDQIMVTTNATEWQVDSLDPTFMGNANPLPAPGTGCVYGQSAGPDNDFDGTPDSYVDNHTQILCSFAGGDESLGVVAALGFGNDGFRAFGMFPVEVFGEAGNDVLQGGPLADKLVGGPGVDTMQGTAGADVIEARDGEDDTLIDCGAEDSAVDAVNADLLPLDDNVDASCDTVNRASNDTGGGTTPPPTGGGGTTPPPAGGGGTTPPPTTGTGGTTVPEQVIPGTNLGGVRFENVVDTGRRVSIPDVRGKDVIAAVFALQKAGINFNLEPFPMNKLRKQLPTSVKPLAKWDDGDIIVQEPAKVTLSGSRSTVTIVVRYWEGATVETCAQELRDLIGLPYAQFEEIAKREGCKVDDTHMQIVKTTKKPGEIDSYSGDRCELGSVNGAGKVVDTTLSIPRDPALQDLRIVVMAGHKNAARGPGPSAKDWSYIAGSNNNHLFLKILTRTGQPVNGARVTLDTGATWPAGEQADGQKEFVTGNWGSMGGGIIDQEFRTGRKAGMILIGARASDSKGHSICGAAEIPAKLIGSGKGGRPQTGDYFNTAAGRSYKRLNNGQWLHAGPAKPLSQLPHAGRTARAEPRGFFEDLLAKFTSIFTGQHAVSTKGATVGSLANSNIVLGQIALGQPLKANAPVSQIISGGGGNVVGIGKGNIISNDGASIISNDGASIISGGGGNLTIGFNGSQIISGGGGNIISGGGGNVRSDAVTVPAGDIVGFKGGAIISNDGASAVAATGAAVMAAGGQIISNDGAS